MFYQVKPGRGGAREAARHPSYVAAMEGAEAFGERVYAEGQQRGVERRGLRRALGDGAPWIWNQVELHFPGAVQVADWYHAMQRIEQVGQTLYGESACGIPNCADGDTRWAAARWRRRASI